MVHDEIVLEVREGTEGRWMASLAGVMQRAGLQVCHKAPIEADASFGYTWADAK